MRIIYTIGLPASGKTTWALEYMSKNPNTKRVNKDELRQMVDGGKWSPKNEKIIMGIRNDLIDRYLNLGFDVIVDDTNFNPIHINKFHELAELHDSVVVSEDFTKVPVEECIIRDLKRSNSVGEKVIRGMYNKYIRPEPEMQLEEVGIPPCIIVDIDGTLAIKGDRSPFEWKRVGEDRINQPITNLVRLIHEAQDTIRIILFSGRDGSCRPETELWLAENGINYSKLFMREAGDMRKDSIVKKEMYHCYIKDSYNVMFVLDDRNQVVDMWRNELGLPCLQVAEGDF